MKIKQQTTNIEYPYLAVMTFGDPIKSTQTFQNDEIVLISMISENGEDCKPYVQYVDGHKQGWFTKDESDYAPLPKGYRIELKQ